MTLEAQALASDPEANDADVRVGRRIRALRIDRGLSLAELAAQVGISIGALSQIERGRSSLRVRVIWPLAAALEVEPSALIADDDGRENDLYCVRADKRSALVVQREDIKKELLSPPGASLVGMVVTVEPGGGTTEYSHKGTEFGLVISGDLELVIDSTRYQLKTGDSFAFKSTLVHSFRNIGTEPCSIVWVNTQKPTVQRDG